MSIFSQHFALGLGTLRLPCDGPNDTEGFRKSVQLVTHALNSGITYVDVGYDYVAGTVTAILKEAFQQTTAPFSVTAKVSYGQDKKADDAKRRVKLYMYSMGLKRIQYFTCWAIRSYEIFENIMKPGGIYDGALQLKEEGLIDHICASLHLPPKDILKIIESGVFEGITISYSVLNAKEMRQVLDAAYEKNIGVCVMNPLGGGTIAQNKDYFSFICGDHDEGNVIHAALRFVKAHPAVDIVLGGVSSIEEFQDSRYLLATPDPEKPLERLERVSRSVAGLTGFCTSCKYCEKCPHGIPTSKIMHARNQLLFNPAPAYNRTGPESLLYNLHLFRTLSYEDGWYPETEENPCIQCGKCQRNCTQKLGIIDAVADTYARAGEVYYTKRAHKQRLEELLRNKKHLKVGLYPNCNISFMVIHLYKEFFGDPDFEWLIFNSDPKQWNQTVEGHVIHSPDEIEALHPDIILICSYKFEEDIRNTLQKYEKCGIKIENLHRPGEIPWMF